MDIRNLPPTELDVFVRIASDDIEIAGRTWDVAGKMEYRSTQRIRYMRSMRDFTDGRWVPYDGMRCGYSETAAARQRLSRAVRRLEVLGLLDCANLKSDAPRVSHVRLSDCGRRVAKGLGRAITLIADALNQGN